MVRKNFLTLLLYVIPFLGIAQTLPPPELACTSTRINGFVDLTWNLPNISCGPFISYDIYYSIGSKSGPYALLTSISNQSTTTYTDVSVDGNTDTIYYYMVSNYNCPGYTAIHSDTLDNLDPFAPFMRLVTVENGDVGIYWRGSSSSEAVAYIIFRYDGGFNPIDTVYGKNIFYYLDTTANPGQQSEQYTISAMDSCGNAGPFWTLPHRTIHLRSNMTNCVKKIKLNWNAYQNWPGDSILEHRLKYSVNGSAFQVDQVLGGQVTAAAFNGFNDGDSICLYVEAVHPDGSTISQSNIICLLASFTQPVSYVYMSNASVTGPDEISVEWRLDNNADIKNLSLHKSADNQQFQTIHTVPPGPFSPVMTFADPTILDKSYYYRVELTDSCDNTLKTGVVRSLHLKTRATPVFVNKLTWNAFEIPGGTVDQYNIYRLDGAAWTLIGAVSGSQHSFDDEVPDPETAPTSFCYRIEAEGTLQPPDSSSFSFIANSNEACAEQLPVVHIPTAIAPEGTNNFFKPVMLFDDPDSYLLQVYNRWGQKIFETTNPSQGWDGRFEGEIVPQGVYAYYLKVQGLNGLVIERKGTVMVIR